MNISKLSRTITFRLTLFYSLFLAACIVMLLGFIYWQMTAKITRRVDQFLVLEKTRLTGVSHGLLPDEISGSVKRDLRHFYFYGLFATDGHLISGNAPHLPPGIPLDGSIHEINLAAGMQGQPLPSRVLAVRLDSGEGLFIGHDVQQITEFNKIMRSAFFWGGSLAILIGLMFGLALSFRPLQRVSQIQQACELIAHGNIRQRLPVSEHRDELDMLAVVVNKMLDEIERLMSDIKSVGDNIAHDLRTPLTRLRGVLYRMQQQLKETPAVRTVVDDVIADADALLLRFGALLRISEIENKQRRAGFRLIQLQEVLEEAVNFIEPLAEDKSIRLLMAAEQVDPINGDSELLFEVMVNLLDNAVKFTPVGGKVEVHISKRPGGAQVDIIDTGAGISESECTDVLNRFRRGRNNLQAHGFGLGLSIVVAILRLHDFGFELGDANPGTRATIFCWPPAH